MVSKFGFYFGSLAVDKLLGLGDTNVPLRAAQIRSATPHSEASAAARRWHHSCLSCCKISHGSVQNVSLCFFGAETSQAL